MRDDREDESAVASGLADELSASAPSSDVHVLVSSVSPSTTDRVHSVSGVTAGAATLARVGTCTLVSDNGRFTLDWFLVDSCFLKARSLREWLLDVCGLVVNADVSSAACFSLMTFLSRFGQCLLGVTAIASSSSLELRLLRTLPPKFDSLREVEFAELGVDALGCVSASWSAAGVLIDDWLILPK